MNDYDFKVEIKYTRRRGSVGFRIGDGGVRILAPHQTPKALLKEMIDARLPWIREQLRQLQAQPPRTTSRRFVDGETLPLLGIHYPLRIRESRRPAVVLERDRLCIDVGRLDDSERHQQRCLQLLQDWLQQQAEAFLPQRLKYWSERLQLFPVSLKIRSYRSRWGSCDQQRRITLNNRLMMAPQAIIDYVIIHELCHLLELNHSPAFWAQVERHCPDYVDKRRWLRSQGAELQLIEA